MCNLYSMKANVNELAKLFSLTEGERDNLPQFDTIYPGQPGPIVTSDAGGRVLSKARWGIPAWKPGIRDITNIRNLDSNFWKSRLADPANRCLVPVTSFCEWTGEKGSKEKVWFAVSDTPVFVFAGIRIMADDEPRYAFLTCEPNALVAPVHPKAMPVILPPDSYREWLECDFSGVKALAAPYPADAMEILP